MIGAYNIIQMFQSPELVHCHKTERVTIFKMPPLSSSKGFYLDDWKEMIWEGGVKVTEKDKVITVTFIGKDGKIFAASKIPKNYSEAIVKTMDSSRGYAVRLENPKGGYLWVGVAFRDRNDAFDFGVIFQDYANRNKMEANISEMESKFAESKDFGLKKGQKITINMGQKKEQNATTDFFSDFGTEAPKKPAPQQSDQDWFADFGSQPPNEAKKKTGGDFNLLDL